MSQEREGYTPGESHVILNSVLSQLAEKSVSVDEVNKLFKSIKTNFFGGGPWVGIQNDPDHTPKSGRRRYIERLEQEGLITIDYWGGILTVNKTIPIDHHLTIPDKVY